MDNSKQIYQFQNKQNKVNEIAALEKKFAELSGELDKAGEKDGIGDILDEDDEEEAKKTTPKPTPTPNATPAKNENSRLTESDKKALSDCQFVFEDAGCAKFVGKTLSEIQAYFGKSDSYGDYYRLGIHFWYYNDYKLEDITFQGVAPSKDYSPFVGKPGRKVDWNASTEETIAQYGTPTKRNDMGSFGIDLTYGNVVFVFRNNKLSQRCNKGFCR